MTEGVLFMDQPRKIRIISLLEQYEVRRCFYGHLHGHSHKLAMEGLYGGIEYRLVSADYLAFKPMTVIFWKISRKILKIKSDYIIKESEYKKLETKYSALKSAVDLLPKMNESDFAKARESLDEITNVINELQKLNYSIDRIKD